MEEFEGTRIKVIGVGGAGGNAVDHMVHSGVMGVEFIAANTDAQALARNGAGIKLALGRSGLGAGAKPEKGQEAALTHRHEIREALEGANMVFVTAGMGGGTGTGAAPVVAEIARELGVLTVGVVTKPFTFEGRRRAAAAESGIEELSAHVDCLITVLNDRLQDVLGEDADVTDCFEAADNVLRNAVAGISEIITQPGMINVDFEDVRTIMTEMGRAMMGSAEAAGEDRAERAARDAIASPLLEGVQLAGARGVLVNISAARKGLKMKEITQVMGLIQEFASEDARVIFGAVYDDSLGDALRVTVVATGLGAPTTTARAGADSEVLPGIHPAPIQFPLRQASAVSATPGLGRERVSEPQVPTPRVLPLGQSYGEGSQFNRPAVLRFRSGRTSPSAT